MWDERHPEAALRVERLMTEIERLDGTLDRHEQLANGRLPDGPFARHRPPPTLERGLDLGL